LASQDTTFEFERKRNRPVKYDRNVMMSTIKAMKRVQEIRVARAERFFQARMKNSKQKQKEDSMREIKQNIDLVINPLAKSRQALRNSVLAEAVKLTEKAPKPIGKKKAAAASDDMTEL
jgi:large subunit ribosomal protein L24e